jgi:tetratricopeptide (TPR) repeat protein
MMKKLCAVVLVGVGVLSGVLFGQERFDLKVRNYFFAGFSGDAASLEKGMKICDDALAAEPKNAEALVWHGAGAFYEAGQAFQKGDQQKGGELWQRGLKEMDQAVELAPDDLGVRIPRGAVMLTASRYMPSPEMARPLVEKGLADFEKTYDLQAASLADLGTHPRGELMIGLADAYSRSGHQEKAQVWFERIQKEMKGTPYEKSASIWLETKTLAPAQAGCLGCHTAAGEK